MICGSFSDGFGNILGSFRIVLGSCWGHLGIILGIILGLPGGKLGSYLGGLLGYMEGMLGYIGCLTIYWVTLNLLPIYSYPKVYVGVLWCMFKGVYLRGIFYILGPLGHLGGPLGPLTL